MIFKKHIFMIWGFLLLVQFCALQEAQAQFKKEPRADYIVALNEQNIKDFLQEVSDITIGLRPDMARDDIANYFDNHMSDKGIFKSTMRYEIPGFPTQDKNMEVNKKQYIATVLKSLYLLEDYSIEVSIQDLKISHDKKSARFKSVTKEKGKMVLPDNSENGGAAEPVFIKGQSICEQKLIISYNNFIQMEKAECATVISFDPFGGKPLVPQ